MRKDIEKAFATLSFAEMGAVLKSLADAYSSKKEKRIAELEAEMALLRGESPKTDSRRKPRKAAKAASPAAESTSAKDGDKRRASPKPKYKDPASGQTWVGRGGTPRWLKAYEAEGRKREEFLI